MKKVYWKKMPRQDWRGFTLNHTKPRSLSLYIEVNEIIPGSVKVILLSGEALPLSVNRY
jgi:hypothetical protein